MKDLKKNKTIAVLVAGSKDSANQKDAKYLQCALLGQGYRWSGGGGGDKDYHDHSGRGEWTLYVDTENKILGWDPGHNLAKNFAYHIIRGWLDNSLSLSETLDTIADPPAPPAEPVLIQGVYGTIVRVYDSGNVEFTADGELLCRANAAVIEGVAKQLGLLKNDKKSLPLVEFYYPSSTSGTSLHRLVRVTRMDDDYIQGYQVKSFDDMLGDFKKFSISRITSSTPSLLSVARLVSFTQE